MDPMTTADPAPLRPRGAARHAANVAAAEAAPARRSRRAATRGSVVGHSQTTGAAVPPPAAPVPTVRAEPDPLPSRRELRRHARTSLGPARTPTADVVRAVTHALTLPLRSLHGAVVSAKAVPVTATAVAACLFVTVATPQPAMAVTPRPVLPALDAQAYTAAPGTTIAVQRDAFAIGRVPIRVPGSPPPPTRGGEPSVRPVAGTIPAAGGFGSRWVRGCASCSTNHHGLDFAAPIGTTVVAAMPGRVVAAGPFGGYGNQVLLQHADGSQTRYAHLSRVGVSVGQTVAAGEPVGAVGNTGVSTGPHLHFEVVLGGTPVDPAVWLARRGLL